MSACAKCDLIRADLVGGICPACRPNGLKDKVKLVFGFGCLAVIAVVVISICILVFNAISGNKNPEQINASSQTETNSIPSPASVQEYIKMDFSEIQRMFRDNQVSGANYFEHRTAIIPGRAVRVREALGTGILVMQSPKTGETIELGFNEQGTRELASVHSGDNVTATCPSVTEMMGQVIIVCSSLSFSKNKSR